MQARTSESFVDLNSEDELEVGSRVRAFYCVDKHIKASLRRYQGKLHSAKITQIDSDQNFELKYDDGDVEPH